MLGYRVYANRLYLADARDAPFDAMQVEIASPPRQLGRESLRKAVELERGLMFWNRELNERKGKVGLRVPDDGGTRERRYICPDCVAHVLAQMMPREP